MPTEQEIIEEIRGRLGDPGEAELPTEQVERALNAALREFSRFYPEREEVSIAVSEGVADYEVPEGTVGVSEVAFLGDSDLSIFDIRYFVGMGDYRNPTVYDPRPHPYLDDVRADYVKGRGRLEIETQILPPLSDGELPRVRLHPAPIENGSLVLVIERLRSLETLPRVHLEGIIQWAEGDCLEYVGRKRSKSVKQIPTATGTLRLDDGYSFRREGREQKGRVEAKWGAGATVLVGG